MFTALCVFSPYLYSYIILFIAPLAGGDVPVALLLDLSGQPRLDERPTPQHGTGEDALAGVAVVVRGLVRLVVHERHDVTVAWDEEKDM